MKVCLGCEKELSLDDFYKKSKHKVTGKQYYASQCKKCYAIRRKGYVRNQREWQGKMFRSLREAAIAALGNECVRCGFTDIRALQVDHINGGGSKETSYRTYRNVVNGVSGYQCLCANCNWIKRRENDEQPHRKSKLT